jgi:membrane-anchored protein YejM (alkaline phosphatase superfamily)
LSIIPQGVLVFDVFFVAQFLKSHFVCRCLKVTKSHASTVLLLVDDRVHEILKAVWQKVLKLNMNQTYGVLLSKFYALVIISEQPRFQLGSLSLRRWFRL